MFTEILEEFVEKIKEKESDWFDQLKGGFSLEGVEREILDIDVNPFFWTENRVHVNQAFHLSLQFSKIITCLALPNQFLHYLILQHHHWNESPLN